MSDYAIIDNTCPEIKLYQQYRKNDAAVNFFRWIREYWQAKYYDYLMNTVIPQLSSCSATSQYLRFFARYWYGIIWPVDVTESSRYDDTITQYDVSYYDYIVTAGLIAREDFQKLIAFILDWTSDTWSIPTLFRMTMGFTGLAGTDIDITQDDDELDRFYIIIPSNPKTIIFKSLVDNYKLTWQLPFGIDIVVSFT